MNNPQTQRPPAEGTQHTPGPWSIKLRKSITHPLEIYDADGGLVATVHGEMHGAKETAGRAKLIASAPELLAALKEILKIPEVNHALVIYGHHDLADAEKAIAKAEGRA